MLSPWIESADINSNGSKFFGARRAQGETSTGNHGSRCLGSHQNEIYSDPLRKLIVSKQTSKHAEFTLLGPWHGTWLCLLGMAAHAPRFSDACSIRLPRRRSAPHRARLWLPGPRRANFSPLPDLRRSPTASVGCAAKTAATSSSSRFRARGAASARAARGVAWPRPPRG